MRQFRKNSRRAVAAVMSIWLSGVVFLFFCYMPMAVSASGHCPLSKPASGHCDKGPLTTGNSERALDSTPRVLGCCGFMPAVFDKVRKIERQTQVSQPAQRPAITRLSFEPILPSSPGTSELYSSFSPLQNKSFIKNRVFRI